jgi:hypothetical protein
MVILLSDDISEVHLIKINYNFSDCNMFIGDLLKEG